MSEEWRRVTNYPRYEVSSLGRVRNVITNNILKPLSNLAPGKKGEGYYRVCLYDENGGRYLYIHRLVATEFIPNPGCKKEVNHKDRNHRNNKVSNLEWVAPQDNRYHFARCLDAPYSEDGANGCSTLTSPVRCLETGYVYASIAQASRLTRIPAQNIRAASDPISPNKRAGGLRWVRLHTVQRRKRS